MSRPGFLSWDLRSSRRRQCRRNRSSFKNFRGSSAGDDSENLREQRRGYNELIRNRSSSQRTKRTIRKDTDEDGTTRLLTTGQRNGSENTNHRLKGQMHI